MTTDLGDPGATDPDDALLAELFEPDLGSELRVFDGPVPTDVIDTSPLTGSGLPGGPAELVPPELVPGSLVPRLPGQGPHPLGTTPAGPELVVLLGIFCEATLTDAGLVDYIGACERAKAWVEARQLAAVAELTARCAALRGVGPAPDQVPAEVLAAAEISPALGISPVGGQARVALAAALTRLPGTRLGLATGALSLPKARAVVEAVEPLTDAAAAAVEARVLPRAPAQTVPALRAALARAVIAADPAAAERRTEAARAERGVWREVLGDGMGRLTYLGPVEDVEAAYQWVTAMATTAQRTDRTKHRAQQVPQPDQRPTGPVPQPDQHVPQPVRTLGQARADVLGDLGAQGLAGLLPADASVELPRRHGRAPQIGVVVAANTLLGADDEPAELVGAGPITAEVARRIAGDGTWRRLLTEPGTGRLQDITAHTYQPPQHLADFVLARDKTCRGLGCRMPATRCDLDHTLEWPCGPTCAANLCALCRRHHRIKTLTDTRLESDGAGGLWWTLPTGKRYHRPPHPVLDHPALVHPTPGPTPAEPPPGQAPGQAPGPAPPDSRPPPGDIPPF